MLSTTEVEACVKFVVVAGFIDPTNASDWNVMILPTAGYYDKTSLYQRWRASDVDTSYTLKGMYCYGQKCAFAFNKGMVNEIALHIWDFEQLSTYSISYQVSTLQIIDSSTGATMTAMDFFFHSPTGSDIYPFIYTI